MKLLELNQYVPKYMWKYKKKLFVDFFLLLFIVFHHNTTQLINGHILNPSDTLPLFHLILLLYTNVPKECYVY